MGGEGLGRLGGGGVRLLYSATNLTSVSICNNGKGKCKFWFQTRTVDQAQQ